MNIYAYPGRPLAPNVQRFVDRFLQLESTVRAGEATDIEQFVYVTANLAIRHARGEQELWTMLQQWHELLAAVADDDRFPQAYQETLGHAVLCYRRLMNTTAPSPGGKRARRPSGKPGKRGSERTRSTGA